jgi:hypothetical protein
MEEAGAIISTVDLMTRCGRMSLNAGAGVDV